MKRHLSAIFFALLIVISGALFFLQQAAQHRDEAASGAVALVTASDLAKIGSAGLQAGLSEQAVGSTMADMLKRSGREGDRYRLVMRNGKQLAASNWPGETAPRPLNLTEKPLYDLILGLPVEGAKLKPAAQGAHAAAPVLVAGQRVGMVEIVQTTKTAGPALISPLQWGAIGLGILVIAGLALAQPKLGAWAGVVLPLGVAFVLGQLTGANLASTAQVLLDNLNTTARAVDEAMRAVAISNGLTLAGDVARLDSAVVAGAVDGAALNTSLLFLGGLGAVIAAFISFGAASSTWRALKENPTAYAYVAPALLGMLALAFFPFFYGFVLSFTDTTLLNQGASWSDRWVGLANYGSILGDFNFGGNGAAFNYQNFYWTLGVTIVWTASNETYTGRVTLLTSPSRSTTASSSPRSSASAALAASFRLPILRTPRRRWEQDKRCDIACVISIGFVAHHAIACDLIRSHAISKKYLSFTTVRVLENASGTRSWTESLPEVFLHDNC